MIGTIKEHFDDLDKIVSDKGYGAQGWSKIPETSIVGTDTSNWNMEISSEFTRLVQKHPDTEFSIVRDPQEGVITVAWGPATQVRSE